jgi:DNA-directed RNA polymerase subunit M/transcription elongation factor TFIIS
MAYVTIRLTTKGDVSRASVACDGALTMVAAQTYFGKKQAPSIVGHYGYKDYTVYVVGYNKGKAGTENKCALPKPYDKTILFGEILFVGSRAKGATETITDLVPLQKADYEGFVEAASGQGAPTEAEGVEEPVDEDEELAEFEEEEEEGDSSDIDGSEVEAEIEIEIEPEIEEKPKRKKKVIPSQILSGFQKQSLLIVSESGSELVPDSDVNVPERQACMRRFEFLGLCVGDLEHEIFLASLTEAKAKHIFPHWKNSLFREIHNYRQYRLFNNLHPDSPVNNPRLFERVQDGELSMADLARLDDMELYPENWKRLQDMQTVKEQRQLESKAAASTDMFKCGRCGKRETTYYEMQTRSADEPMTIFITCCNCGKKWKQ